MTMSSPADDDRTTPRSSRVAVDVLQQDQRVILYDGDEDRRPPIQPITEPFGSRREIINWWQAAAVRTFGHLADDFPARAIVRDGALEAALLGELSDAASNHRRQRLVEHCMGACQTAYRDLEQRAHEWLPTEDGSGQDYTRIDPTEQRHIAMRPSFSRLDAEQGRSLAALWGGFEDRERLSRWVHGLPAVASFGETLDADLATGLARDGHAREMLLAGTDLAASWRERFAATVLLPAFARRARKLRGGEQTRRQRDDNPWNEARNQNE